MIFENKRIYATLLLLFGAACGAEHGSAETPSPIVIVGKDRPAPPLPTPISSPDTPDSSPTSDDASTELAESVEERSCVTDGDCWPDFCDRGVCAMPGSRNYGRECKPTPPPRPAPPLPPGVVPGLPSAASTCGAYLCLDGRCRSCQSNAECGSAPSTCAHLDGWLGRTCGDYSKRPFSDPNAKPPPSEPIPGVPPLPFTQQPAPPFIKPQSSSNPAP